VVKGYNLEPIRSVYDYLLGASLHVPGDNDEVERELSFISKNCYQTVVPRLVASVSSKCEPSAVFCTDGFMGEVSTGLGVFSSAGTKRCLHIKILGNFYGLGPNQRSPLW
jgi:hypothetical protein